MTINVFNSADRKSYTPDRKASLDMLQKLYEYFLPLQKTFDLAETKDARILKLEKKEYRSNIAMGCVMVVCGEIMLNHSRKANTSEKIWFYMAIAGLILVVISAILWKINAIRLKDLKREADGLKRVLTKKYDMYKDCPLELKYCNPRLISRFYGYIENNKAASIPAAVSYYHRELYKMELMRRAFQRSLDEDFERSEREKEREKVMKEAIKDASYNAQKYESNNRNGGRASYKEEMDEWEDAMMYYEVFSDD